MSEAPSPIDVVELDDHTAEAAALGLACSVSIARPLSDQVEPRVALQRLRNAVLGTAADPAMETIRAVALRGEQPSGRRLSPDWYEAQKRFISRVRAGIGGVSEAGTMLALTVEGRRGLVMMICHVGFGLMRPTHNPGLVLTTGDDSSFFYIEPVAVRSLR